MSVWERFYDAETLYKARNEVKIEDVIRKRNHIQVKISNSNYTINVPIRYNSPYNIKCSCDKKNGCEHEAAFRYYLDEHPELLIESVELNSILKDINTDMLKEFLLNEFKQNTLLTNNFLKEFSNNKSVDKKTYKNKLKKILRKGEGADFYLHHIYEYDRLEDELIKFLNRDIDELLQDKQYKLGCELLCEIADTLNDDLSTNQEAWFNLVKEYLKFANPLIESIYLTKEEVLKLEQKTKIITKHI